MAQIPRATPPRQPAEHVADPHRHGWQAVLADLARLVHDALPHVDDASFLVVCADGSGSRAASVAELLHVVSAEDHVVSTSDLQWMAEAGPAFDSLVDGLVHRLDTAAGAAATADLPSVVHRLGIQEVVAVPMLDGGRCVGALSLGSTRPGTLTDAAVEVATGYADIAARLVVDADEAARASQQVKNLEAAMASRATIEQAKGMLVVREGCDPDDAFALLRERSQHENRKLRDVAADVVVRGQGATAWLADRITRVALVARALAGPVTPKEAIEIVVRQGMAGLHADAGILVLRDERGVLVPVYTEAVWDSTLRPYGPLTASTAVPLSAAMRDRHPVWVRNRAEARRQFPGFVERLVTESQAWATVPLFEGDDVIGVLGVSFLAPQEFTEPDRLFIHALADLCSTSLVESATRMRAADIDVAEFDLDLEGRTFAATMQLAAALDFDGVPDAAAMRIRSAIGDLDAVVHDLHAVRARRDEETPCLPLDALIARCRELITVTRADLTLTYASRQMLALLGWQPEQRVGRSVWELVHEDDRDQVVEACAGISDGGGASASFRCRLRHADGSWIPVESHQVNRLDDPAVSGFVGTTTLIEDEIDLT